MQPEPRRITRRTFGRTATAAGAALALAQWPDARLDAQQAAGARPEALQSTLLMDLILETRPSVNLGDRRIVEVTGGTFEGPRLKGTVRTPGADWVERVSDQVSMLDVRTLLVTDDDQHIYCSYRGIIHRPSSGAVYWRVTPLFETASPRYEWMNHVVAVGVNFTVPQRVAYRVFQVL